MADSDDENGGGVDDSDEDDAVGPDESVDGVRDPAEGEPPEAADEDEGATEEEREARYDAIYNRGQFTGLQIDPDVDFYPEVADREPGDENITTKGFDLHPVVTFWSAGILIVFVTLTLLFSGRSRDAFDSALEGINTNFGWFYVLAANIFVLSAVFFAVSRFGKIRIGGPGARPEFTDRAWYAMLISAGMGIGLMFYSVAEPILHNASPAPFFNAQPNTEASGEAAMILVFFHWGVHPWGIYALVALGLSFFAYNRGLPLTFRSVFYPLLGPRIYGHWGNLIDILTVLATLSGLATSLGLGVRQAAAGLNYVFGLPDTTWFQVTLIAIITGLATMSVVAGLDAGVKRLSQISMGIALAFVIFFLIIGPALFIVSLFTQSIGGYTFTLPELAWWSDAFRQTGWQGEWTTFYWGWWISWSPFVGMFIARISKGRTIRELVAGVVLFPSLLSFIFLSVFGGSALDVQRSGARDLATTANENVATTLFEMLEEFPLTTATSLLAVALIVSFFVTSSDSGSLVVDHLTSGGKLDAPKPQRVFWALMEGLLAAVLLIGGGLTALQTAAISTGLPFCLVLLVMIWSLRRAFHEELELLEGHYDAEIFRTQHAALLKHSWNRGRRTAQNVRDRARRRRRPREPV